MKNLLIVLFTAVLVFGITINLSAQETKYQKSIKIYTNGYSPYAYHGLGLRHGFNFGRITPAIQFTKANGNFHEFELTNLSINRNMVGTLNDTSILGVGRYSADFYAFSFRYEYSLELLKKQELGKFHLYSGFALSQRYTYMNYKPEVSTVLPSRTHILALNAQFIPRITYDINDRISLDLNMPISFAEGLLNSSRIDNPSIPVASQRNTQFHFLTNTSFQLRFGVQIKL